MDKRIKFSSQNTNLLPPKPKSSFRHLKQGIQEFHRKYVLVPADKAADNVVVVCRLHYINTLKQELDGTRAYPFEREPYLCMSKFSLSKALCKLRISAHQLMIELGRYKKNKLQRDERICKQCDTSNVEDEFHFLFECSNYNIERRDFFHYN